MTDAPSTSAIVLAWLAVVIVAALIVAGAAWYGFSPEVHDRLWKDIFDRPGGPMTFRFILQPTMAAIAASRDGIRDARLGRSPYFWSLIHSPDERSERLWQGAISTARIVLLGIGMDAIYQYKVLHTFYPGEAALIALILALVPYILLRGPIARVARRWTSQATTN